MRQGEGKRRNKVGKQGNKWWSNDRKSISAETTFFVGFREIGIWGKKP